MTGPDAFEIAEAAGLRHVDPARLAIVRRRCGRGFTYWHRSRRVDDRATRRRIDELAVPPAWEDVRIARHPDAHVQAVGVDADGRMQYRYHERFRSVASARKFARLATLDRPLARLRAEVERRVDEAHRAPDAWLAGDEPETSAAIVIALIDETLVRVGNRRSAESSDTFGAATWQARHVEPGDDGLFLSFRAKGGVDRRLQLRDPRITDLLLRRCDRSDPTHVLLPGAEGGPISGAAIADRLARWGGAPMTAKELRTWGATATMVEALCTDPVADETLAAFDAVAERLGNTRAVARDAYVAPDVVEAHGDGRLAELWAGSRRSNRFTRAEQALRKLWA